MQLRTYFLMKIDFDKNIYAFFKNKTKSNSDTYYNFFKSKFKNEFNYIIDSFFLDCDF